MAAELLQGAGFDILSDARRRQGSAERGLRVSQ